MAEGLQVFDSSGRQTFDSKTIVFKKLGEFTVRNYTAGYLIDDNIIGKNIIVLPKALTVVSQNNDYQEIYPTFFSVSGNKLAWSWLSGYRYSAGNTIYDMSFIYGWLG